MSLLSTRSLAASLFLSLALVACGPPPDPPVAPSAPRDVVAVAGNTTATVSWLEPASDGGSAITGYQLTGTGGVSLSAAAGDRSIVITGLTNGVTYTFSVTAQNAVGMSPSASTAPVIPVAPPGVPGVPTGVVASAGDALAVVSWSAPVDQGTSAITSYRVVALPGGASAQATAPSTTATVSGLANGTTYTFIVMATNAAGEGAPSAPSAGVTPSAAPAVSRLPYKGIPPSSSYTSSIIQVTGGALESSASTLAAGGYVLTCAVYNTAGYTLVGLKPSIGSASYTSQVNQVASTSVSTTARSMGAGGYLITAIVYDTNTTNYTLFGTKLSNTTYDTRVNQVVGRYLDSTISANASAGYVTTAMESTLGGYMLISVRDNADPRTWSSQMQQVSAGSLDSTVTAMASAGYAVTAMVYDSFGYTVVGMKQSGAQTATGAVVDLGTDMANTVSGRASAGYLTLAVYPDTTGYAFASSK